MAGAPSYNSEQSSPSGTLPIFDIEYNTRYRYMTYRHHESSISKLKCCASISGTILIFDIEEYIPISNTVIFDIEAPRNEKWPISGIRDVEESSISNAFSSISDCFNIEDSSISAFKTYTNIKALCFDVEGASILILAGPARAGLQKL
jgi:hypothetical protein